MNELRTLTQGGESNYNGRWLEANVEWHLKARRIPLADYREDDASTRDMFRESLAVRRVPYTSIYGCRSTSEFVLYNYDRATRIECRVQETPGSVDEKFPYLFENARDRMPEREVILLIHGTGARPEALEWLKRKCSEVESKMIQVFNLSEFNQWLRMSIYGV